MREESAFRGSGSAIGPQNRSAGFSCGESERIHRRLGAAGIGCGNLALHGVCRIGYLPGSDRLGSALERMGGIHAGLRIGAAVNGAQVADALLREEREQFPFEGVIAAGLAGEMVEIDG